MLMRCLPGESGSGTFTAWYALRSTQAQLYIETGAQILIGSD